MLEAFFILFFQNKRSQKGKVEHYQRCGKWALAVKGLEASSVSIGWPLILPLFPKRTPVLIQICRFNHHSEPLNYKWYGGWTSSEGATCLSWRLELTVKRHPNAKDALRCSGAWDRNRARVSSVPSPLFLTRSNRHEFEVSVCLPESIFLKRLLWSNFFKSKSFFNIV